MSTAASSSPDPERIPPAKRRRLYQCFQVGLRNVEQDNREYAGQMFSQCVGGDPWTLDYAQAFLENLHAKYNNNKKAGGTLAMLKGAAAKAAMKKAKGKQEWQQVVKSGVELLNINPWDASTLVAMGEACEALEADECQLFYLKAALDTDPKDPWLNRLAALALARQGHFAQAITCWHRVEQAKPGDEEALKMIGQLTIERTMPRTEYEGKRAARNVAVQERKEGAATPQADGPTKRPPPAAEVELTRQQRLEQAIEKNPGEVRNYADLAELYAEEGNFDKAEQVVSKALSAVGGGDLQLREQLEDYQVRRYERQLEIAEQRARQEPTEEAVRLAKRMKAELNRVELQIYAARVDRNPGNDAYFYELGVRLKRAGKFQEAIKHFQKSRPESKLRAAVYLELGECFHYISQRKLAMTNYVRAIEESSERDTDVYRLALYRAGVLATGLKDFDAAEKYLTELAAIDFGYRDVADRLDKLNDLRHNK